MHYGRERGPSVAWMEPKRRLKRPWAKIAIWTTLTVVVATAAGAALINANNKIKSYINGSNPCEEADGVYSTDSLQPGESVTARGLIGGFLSVIRPSVDVVSDGNGSGHYNNGRVALIEKRPEARKFTSGSFEVIIYFSPGINGGTIANFECPEKPAIPSQ